MKYLRRLMCVAFFCAAAVSAQVPVSVGFQKNVQLPVAGATAAYSLDSEIVEATAADGIVSIQGKRPGTTNIIVVTSAGAQTVSVTVPQPPPSYPPGFEPPLREGAAAESGSYEVRYNSDPSQLTNSVEFTRRQGDSFNRMLVTNATLLTNNSTESRVAFPIASYEISRPRYDLTFIDQQVNSAPLTIDGYLVRGLHVREGPWQFHGGFTSVAIFQGLFLSTDPEYVAGLSRTFSLHDYGSLEGGYYYFQNPRSQLGIANNGGVGSLTYRIKPNNKFKFLAELGASHWGMAFATRGAYETKKTHITGSFRIVPQRFAALAVNNERGTFGDLNASRDLTSRLFMTANLSQSGFNLPALRQSTFVGNTSLTFKLNRNFSLLSGVAYSRFQSQTPLSLTINSLNLPIGIDFASRHFGTGFEYQRTENFDGSGGNDYSINLRGAAGKFLMSAFFRHDVQVPTISAVFAQIPGLQDLLERAGIVVTSPDQLAQLLNNSALLATLGFSAPLTVNLAPARNDLSASASWLGRGHTHPQVSLGFFDSRTELIQGSFRFSSLSLSYSQRITSTNDVVASTSLLRTVNSGAAPDVQPLFSVSLRHRFSTAPSLLLPGRHGSIHGHVFRDDESSARYSGQAPGIADVEVRLDETRITHTDANGYYAFHHVPFGAHTVEARFESPEPFFHTTDSPTAAEMNSTADFGINFSKGQLFGFLLNDAGKGVNGVTIELHGAGAPRTTQTNMEGKFVFLGLGPGAYTISTEPGSYPSGYSLQNLPTKEVSVETGKPAKIEMSVKAVRVLSGRVMAYDRAQLKPVPVPDVTVRIEELQLETHTGANGVYLFRNLPAGTYTLVGSYNGKEITRSVTIPADPINMRDVDLDGGTR